jgi:hypothetical protein
MPYPGIPKSKWPAMERCVADLKAKGDGNPYAICHASVMGETKHKSKKKKKAFVWH